MDETSGRKWSLLDNWVRRKRIFFWIIVPILTATVIFLIVYVMVNFSGQSEQPLSFLILIWILAYLGSIGLTIWLGGTHNASRLTKKGSEKQKSVIIAITISIILTFVWLITFSTYTTQTDYSTIDEALIESGLIEDKSHLLYVSSLLVWLILMVCFLIQVVVFYFVIEMLKKSKA